MEIYEDDLASCRAIGEYGAGLIEGEQPVILTHCNAGALATAGYGTALGVIRSVHARNPRLHVLADETRPLLQGARLTAWELTREGISVELITDNMAGHFMSRGLVTHVVVGADRITANGDVANKIGTYTVSVLAREHGIPFYVAAPFSTVDRALADGSAIPIEERDASEVTGFGGVRWAPVGVRVRNPAFDVTPARQRDRHHHRARSGVPPVWGESEGTGSQRLAASGLASAWAGVGLGGAVGKEAT